MGTLRKRCSQCKRVLPVTEFHRRAHYVRAGVRAACKRCTAATARNGRAAQASRYDPIKAAVRYRTHEGIRRGNLAPQPCQVCGDPQVEAHHPTYEGENAHLEIEWLCRRHHAVRHGKRPWTRQIELFPAL